MTFASADLAQMSYIEETAYGTTPVVGNGANLRMTGETLSDNLTKESDKEINSDGQLTSTTTVGANTGGDLKFHMQYAEYDNLLGAVCRNAWVVFGTNGVGSTFTADFATTTITASVATSGASDWTTLQKGQWFRINCTGSNSGKYLRVSASVAPTTTVITLDASTPAVVASAVTGCTISAARLTNGTTLRSFTLERHLSDVTQFFSFPGQAVSKFTIGFNSGALTEGTFTFMGKLGARAAVTVLPGSTAASNTYDIQNAVTGVGNLWENGAPITTTSIKTFTMEFDSGLRAQDAIGTLGLVGLGMGTFMAKGTIEVYFADGTIYDKFIGDTYTSFTVSTRDASHNGYVFTFPKAMLTSGKVSAGAKNTDVMASFEWTAYGDKANAVAALRKTVLIDRCGAAVA